MKEFWKNYLQSNLYFWIFSVISIALIITSFFLPPVGIISETVALAVGEIFAFAALGTVIKAIDAGKTARISKGDVEFSIGDKDENV